MSETRERVREAVARNPGVHFRRLQRTLDITPGQAQHHLRRLRRADALVAEDHRGRTHYYPADSFDPWERAAIAALRRETARDVVVHLLEHGESDPGSVAESLGIARSTLEWHLDTLVDADVVEKRRVDGNRVTLDLTRPEDTARLLRTVAPSLPERLVDRFERLVDDLLEE